MNADVSFEVSPGTLVKVALHDLNYRGMVVCCRYNRGNYITYDVEYVNDKGDFCRGEFHPFDLSRA